MSNEVKQEAPERITISNGFGVWQTYGSWKTSSYSGDNVVVEYVRADLLATVRREEREAALKEAVDAVWALYHKSEVSESRWNAAITHARGAVERASANQKGEVNG